MHRIFEFIFMNKMVLYDFFLLLFFPGFATQG